ncbi:MAG: threonyl-tRNA synthetase [Patescibacteria group bacterium]|jgi:threonyl-tRNA synthetase
MKTLHLHCDYIKFTGLKKAIKTIDELAPDQNMGGEATDCLVVLTAIEKGDNDSLIPQLVEEIRKITDNVKTKKVVLYPYAHLSSKLGSPKLAIELLAKAKAALDGDFEVLSAPFGYYKTFEFKVKGHPMSELSREFVAGDVSGNEEAEAELTDSERSQILRQISKAKLDTSKLAENDHRILGGKMDLWSFNNVAPGMVFWHKKGLHIKNKMAEYWRQIHRKSGYDEISTPQVLDRKLWEVSGHWGKYRENMFTTKYEKRDFAVKPMNCPGGMLVYKATPKSYRDLPIRAGELGVVHRRELSGTLGGLMRVIQFTQDDAHLFCTEEQLKDEIAGIISIIKEMYSVFGVSLDHVELSTRPEKRIGDDATWDHSEEALEGVLKESGMKYVVNEGDGAFYGPKIDFHIKDSLDRTWQCATIQLDMALPQRFDLTYQAEDGSDKVPMVLHRVVFGSMERFIGIFTEHVDGKFPLWINPNQVKVMSLNDDAKEYAGKVHEELFTSGFESELDDRNLSMGKKAREASIQRFNYIVTVGAEEMASNTIAVKIRGEKEINKMSLDDFKVQLAKEISEKK